MALALPGDLYSSRTERALLDDHMGSTRREVFQNVGKWRMTTFTQAAGVPGVGSALAYCHESIRLAH